MAYFELAGGYDEPQFIDRSASPRLDQRGRLLPTHDPVYVVLAHKLSSADVATAAPAV